MTLAELGQRMSNAEFELWMAEEILRNFECPNCGHEAKDMNEVELVEVKCPICYTKYGRTRKPRDDE
jgi:transcription elongation factor Elf1